MGVAWAVCVMGIGIDQWNTVAQSGAGLARNPAVSAARRLRVVIYEVGRPVAVFFFFQAEDGIRDVAVTGVQTCALPISCLTRDREGRFGAVSCPGHVVGGKRRPVAMGELGERLSLAEPIPRCAGEREHLDRKSVV